MRGVLKQNTPHLLVYPIRFVLSGQFLKLLTERLSIAQMCR